MVGVTHISSSGLVGRIVLVTEVQQTQQALMALIALLLVVAAMLAILTIWYWRHTNPRRRMRHLSTELDGPGYEAQYDANGYEPNHDEGYDPRHERDRADDRYYGDEQLVDHDGSYEDARHRNYR